MANNRTMKNFAENRQKILAVAAIVIVLIVIWQTIGLFRSDSPAPAAEPAKNTMMSAQTPGGTATPPPAGGPGGQAAMSASLPPTASSGLSSLVSSESFSPLDNVKALKQQQDQQVAYLASLNKLQSLKVERDIAETSQAIAAARLATATADKNMSDLLTRVSQSQQVSISDYAGKLGGGVQGAESARAPTPPSTPVIPIAQYVVISVSMQLNKWNAVLGYQGKLYMVSLGDTLPGDGSVVTKIDRNGVTLSKDGQTRRITIVNSV